MPPANKARHVPLARKPNPACRVRLFRWHARMRAPRIVLKSRTDFSNRAHSGAED
ncbi:hypothetical protein DP49_5143 [Burkholderia pseudomallei]|nr:hypothetical protein DP49_5143 [Burkholderia pseudomallei]